MAINPGIPIPSAMPRVSLEIPLNGAEDGEDEGVAVCTVDSVNVIAGTDAEVAAEPIAKVGVVIAEDVVVAEDDPDWSVILKNADWAVV